MMSVRLLTVLIAATAAGWLTGGWMRVDAPLAGSASEGLPSARSILADRSSSDALVLKGELSLQIHRAGKWASEVAMTQGAAAEAEMKIAGLDKGTAREVAAFVLYQRWLKIYPSIALSFASDEEARERAVALVPLDRLIAMVKAEPLLAGDLALSVAMVDPDKALALSDSCSLYSHEVSGAILEGFVRFFGLEEAANRLEGAQSKIFRDHGASKLVGLWTEHDPSAALAWITDRPDSDKVFGSTVDWSSTVAREFPEKALSLARELESPTLRHRTVARALERLGRTDAERAFEELGKSDLPDLNRMVTAERIVREVVETNPARALELLETFGAEESFLGSSRFLTIRERTYDRGMQVWSKQNQEEAHAFAESIEDPDLRRVALEAIADGKR